MKTSTALNAALALDGLKRAWPAKDGGISVELTDDLGCLRAGHVDADGHCELLDHALDPQLPDLRPRAWQLVVHRAGRRAVEIDPGRSVVRKNLREGRAATLWQRSEAFAAPARAAGFRVPDLVALGVSHVDMTLLAGIDLEDPTCPISAWEAVAERWPALLGLPTDLPAHTGQQEASVLSQWVAHARRHRSLGPLDLLEARSAQIQAQLCARGRELVTAHRDLHAAQILWDGHRPGLLDFDTAGRAEVELDLGNLIAHVELAQVKGRIDAATTGERLAVLDSLADSLGAEAGRLHTYLRASRLRLACVHSFRPGAAEWLPRWLEIALAARPL